MEPRELKPVPGSWLASNLGVEARSSPTPSQATITHFQRLPDARQGARSPGVGQGVGEMGGGFTVWRFLLWLSPGLAVTSCAVPCPTPPRTGMAPGLNPEALVRDHLSTGLWAAWSRPRPPWSSLSGRRGQPPPAPSGLLLCV